MSQNSPTTTKDQPPTPEPWPGTRAALMTAAADALRAAAADVLDPRTTPLPGPQGNRPRDVAAWLSKRAELMTPPPMSSWQRNQLARVSLVDPELRPELRRAVVDALLGMAGLLGGYGVIVHDLPHLVPDLVAAFVKVDAERNGR